ncbi:hydroxyproline N-acetylglucosaminyltransferase [Acrasis kona]|uniref:Hydroxyproline N-acetylglucosaminyltransferase n=1 Tax=Acrasis kona TaxID=1008807 RepID=A0AAW2YWC8_9EUKA
MGKRTGKEKLGVLRTISYVFSTISLITFLIFSAGYIGSGITGVGFAAFRVQQRPINTRGLPTIFLSIASYRDPQCMFTLLWALKQAKYPERVFIGVLQQNHPDMDVDCLSISLQNGFNATDAELIMKWRNQIRMGRYSYLDARGPTWARYMAIEKLFQQEDYVMQVDSHSRFVPQWDELIIDNIKQLPPNSVISHYPSLFVPGEEDENGLPKDYQKIISRMCKGFYNSDDILQPSGALYALDKKESRSNPFLGAGFTFYPGKAHETVKMDPYLPYLFHGEEILFSMKMVAAGYKLYSPAENIVLHYYYRKDFPRYWDLSSIYPDFHQLQKYSLMRTKYIIGTLDYEQVENVTWTLQEIDKYGINWKDPVVKGRLDKYFTMFEMDLKNKKMGDFCSKGLPEW